MKNRKFSDNLKYFIKEGHVMIFIYIFKRVYDKLKHFRQQFEI